MAPEGVKGLAGADTVLSCENARSSVLVMIESCVEFNFDNLGNPYQKPLSSGKNSNLTSVPRIIGLLRKAQIAK